MTASRDGEAIRLQRLGVADVSALPRTTVKGPGSGQALRASGWPAPEHWFLPVAREDGSFVARTGSAEYWIEGPFEPAREAVPDALVYARQDASLFLCGTELSELLADVLSVPVDLTSPTLHMTQLARTSCARLARRSDPPSVQIWFDPTYAIYLGGVVLRIAEELGGGLLGTDICQRAGLLPPERDRRLA
jgi:hypothetical protein